MRVNFSNFKYTDLIFITSFSNGGAQTFVKGLYSFLSNKKRNPLIIYGGNYTPNSNDEDLSKYNYCVLKNLDNSFNLTRDFYSLIGIIKILKQNPKAKIITNSGKISFLVRIACLISLKKCVFIVHGWSFTGFQYKPIRFIYFIFETLLELIDSLFCIKVFVSFYDKKNRPIRLLNFFPNLSYVIHNGSKDLIEGRKVQIQLKNKTKNKLNLLTIARLSDQKDLVSLIKAVNLNQKIYLNIVGEGPNRYNLEKLVRKLNLENRIKFSGNIKSDKIFNEFKKCDIFILVSFWEGFPISCLEAMSCSKPIIVSDVGGCSEIFETKTNLKFGQVIPKGNNPEIIVSLIKKYFQNKLLQTHSLNARSVFLAEFQLNKKLQELYQKIWITK